MPLVPVSTLRETLATSWAPGVLCASRDDSFTMKRQIISFVSFSVCVFTLAFSGCAKDDQTGTGEGENESASTDPTGDEEDDTETGGEDPGKETATGSTTDGESAGFVPETDIPGPR